MLSADFASIDLALLRPPLDTPRDTPAPTLQWIAIAKLRVDRSYQLEILKGGRRNIERIAEGFDWRKFAPVIVAPIDGGLFAIVDGQHRTHAALLIGKDSVPCAIVQADRRMQAEAFAAINGNVTRMSAINVFRAAVGAGERDAVELRDLCAACGVRIMGYPVSVANMKPGDCTAPAALQTARKRWGDVILAKALRAIMAQADPRGLVTPVFITGACATFERLPFDLAEANVATVFSRIDIRKEKDLADRAGQTLQERLLARLAQIARVGQSAGRS